MSDDNELSEEALDQLTRPEGEAETSMDVPVGNGLLLPRIFAPAYGGDLSQEAVVLHFDQHLAAIVERYKSANADGKVTIGEMFGIVGELAAASAFVIKAFNDAKTDETERAFDQIVEAAEAAFDNNIIPIDFPPGPMIEMYLEGQARMLIRPALTYVRDRIQSIPNPAPELK